MSSDKISLLYTTARTHLIERVIDRWINVDEVDIEMVIVTDSHIKEHYSPKNLRYFINDGPRNCVTGWNLAAKHSVGDILVQVSDDLIPPKNWAGSIRNVVEQMKKHRPDIALNLLDQICAKTRVHHPVLTRMCYEKTWFLYPPDFESMFCDNWFYAFHKKNSHYATSKTPFWLHEHRTTHNVAVDEVTRKHESPERYQRGKATFLKYVRLHSLQSSVPESPNTKGG
jgi:hypothetical protein